MINHKSWKVPERRVSKFVKRQKRASVRTPDDGNDDESLVSSVSGSLAQRTRGVVKGAGRGIRSIFKSPVRSSKSNSSKKGLEIETPQPAESAPVQSLLGPVALDSIDEDDDILPVPVPEVQPDEAAPGLGSVAVDAVERIDEPAMIYEDDNDGNKAGALCDGCIIL
jgi:hypothetical protein